MIRAVYAEILLLAAINAVERTIADFLKDLWDGDAFVF